MRPITILLVFLSGLTTSSASRGKHGVLNIAIDMCKKAGTLSPKPGRPSIAVGCQHQMKFRAPSWNCQVCMNACLRYHLGDDEAICERCVKNGCGDDVMTCGGKSRPECFDGGLLSSIPHTKKYSFPWEGEPEKDSLDGLANGIPGMGKEEPMVTVTSSVIASSSLSTSVLRSSVSAASSSVSSSASSASLTSSSSTASGSGAWSTKRF